jgi:hypothetical protein
MGPIEAPCDEAFQPRGVSSVRRFRTPQPRISMLGVGLHL